jgi:hypothetical protein
MSEAQRIIGLKLVLGRIPLTVTESILLLQAYIMFRLISCVLCRVVSRSCDSPLFVTCYSVWDSFYTSNLNPTATSTAFIILNCFSRFFSSRAITWFNQPSSLLFRRNTIFPFGYRSEYNLYLLLLSCNYSAIETRPVATLFDYCGRPVYSL